MSLMASQITSPTIVYSTGLFRGRSEKTSKLRVIVIVIIIIVMIIIIIVIITTIVIIIIYRLFNAKQT